MEPARPYSLRSSLYRMIVREAGGRLVVAGANALVRQAFDITGLGKIIPLADSVPSGLALLRA